MTFNMKAARAACDKYAELKSDEIKDTGESCHYKRLMSAMLPAALDEIARLQADNAGWQSEHEAMHEDSIKQAKRIAELNTEAQELHDRKEEFAKRIAELEGNQCYSGTCSYAVNYEEDMTTYRIRIDKQHATLKKLGQAKRARGKALVEERAAHNFNKTYYKSGGRSWEEICQKEWLKEARKQLRQEKLL